MQTTIQPEAVVVPSHAVSELPTEGLGHLQGVTNRVLWRDHHSLAGVLIIAAGHQLGPHTHRVNHHHIWFVEGSAVVLGTDLSAGSYVHIPAGVEHDIDATTTAGCTVFYLYAHPGPELGAEAS